MDNNNGLKYVALEISENDLHEFYENVLGGKVINEREVNEDVAVKLFGINGSFKIANVKCEGFELELYIYHESSTKLFYHLSLEKTDAFEIYKKAQSKNYVTKEIIKDNIKTYFIKDHNGNMFELKPSSN